MVGVCTFVLVSFFEMVFLVVVLFWWWFFFGVSSYLLMCSHGRRPLFVDFIAVGWKCCYSPIVDWACCLLLNREPGGSCIVELFRDRFFGDNSFLVMDSMVDVHGFIV